MLAASGLESPDEIKREHINRRVGMNTIAKYSEIYPSITPGCLLTEESIPESYKGFMAAHRLNKFVNN